MIKNFSKLLFQSSYYPINRIVTNQFSKTSFIQNIKSEIDKMIKEKPVVVFMKGTPNAPRCGFSKGVVQILNLHNVKFEAHDVLENEELRSGIKEFSSWPTIPQVYFNGEFIGGYDILLDMHKTGELIKELEQIGIKSNLADKNEEKS
jgi:monothiol glutaredoxin